MSPRLRRLALTAHVTASVGWLGAVVAFLALVVAGLTGGDPQQVRGVALAADVITWWVIVPLCGASLLTGLVQSLGTEWGLFRHYWVVLKLVITALATLVLLLHTQPIGMMARAAADGTVLDPAYAELQLQLALAAGAAVVVLVVATTLSIYKPRGLTPYGWRKRELA